jgi:hypothetical protein
MAGYTRQSSYTDGDVITAAHSNDEFNQVLAAFVNTTGHKHDGTAAEGPVIGLIGDPGVTTPLNKVVVDNTNNRVGLFLDAGGAGSSVEQIRFQDGVIVPVTDNDIDLGTSSLEFKNAFFDGAVTTDTIVVNSTIGHDDDTDLMTLADGIVTVAGEISVTTLDIGGTNVTSTAAELNILDGVTSTAAELNILDGVTATTAELNIMDGGTSATSTTVADADRVVFNDGGTMKQVAVTDLAAYFDDEITAMPNLTSVGTLTTLTVDNVIINGTTIGHTDDTDLITLADGIATVAGEVSMTTLDIGGTNVTATAAELNIMDGVTATTAELNIMDGVTATTAELNIMDGVTATTTELNLMDGGTSASSTTLAAADRLIVNDNGTMKQVALSDFETFFESALDTTSNITTVGALDSGSITSGFGNIDTGSSTITTTGLITGGSLDIDDVVINGTTIGHTDDTDLMTVADGVLTVAGEVSMTTLDIGGTNVTSTAAELNILDGVTSTAAELNILDGVTSTAAELNILDGVTSTAAELNILDGVTATTAELNYSDTGASVGTVVASKVVTVDANKDVASFRNITLTGELDAGSLDVSGDADIDGTLEADAITVNGTALNTVIANEATALAIALG